MYEVKTVNDMHLGPNRPKFDDDPTKNDILHSPHGSSFHTGGGIIFPTLPIH